MKFDIASCASQKTIEPFEICGISIFFQQLLNILMDMSMCELLYDCRHLRLLSEFFLDML